MGWGHVAFSAVASQEISQDSAKQRGGRAGREAPGEANSGELSPRSAPKSPCSRVPVTALALLMHGGRATFAWGAAGTVYRLYTENCFQQMQAHRTPEVLSCDLSQLFLQLKVRTNRPLNSILFIRFICLALISTQRVAQMPASATTLAVAGLGHCESLGIPVIRRPATRCLFICGPTSLPP